MTGAPFPEALLRRTELDDVPRIAALHVVSWRATYRGLLSDSFLDGPVEAERLAKWQGRCGNDLTRWPLILVAEDEGASPGAPLAGFICVFPAYDARWGSLVDNLHVAPDRKRQRIGRRLLHAAATILIETGCVAPVHLWVFAENRDARAAYDRFGGRAVEQCLALAPDGHQMMTVRYAWESPASLRRLTASPGPSTG